MESYDVGAVIDTIYGFETNIRLQNIPGKGFYGCFTDHQIMWRGINKNDFNKPLAEPVAQITNRSEMNNFCFSESLESVCNFLLKEAAGRNVRMYNHAKMHPDTNVEHVLFSAHQKGARFIIESTWDLGYDVYLINPKSANEIKTVNCYKAVEISSWIASELQEEKTSASANF